MVGEQRSGERDDTNQETYDAEPVCHETPPGLCCQSYSALNFTADQSDCHEPYHHGFTPSTTPSLLKTAYVLAPLQLLAPGSESMQSSGCPY